jgi:hypothetical protein
MYLKKSGKASRLIVEVVLQLPPKSRSQVCYFRYLHFDTRISSRFVDK